MESDNRYEILRQIQKRNYWRGFRACMILVVVPGVIAFILFCDAIIKLN